MIDHEAERRARLKGTYQDLGLVDGFFVGRITVGDRVLDVRVPRGTDLAGRAAAENVAALELGIDDIMEQLEPVPYRRVPDA